MWTSKDLIKNMGIIKLTEQDLTQLVNNVINESQLLTEGEPCVDGQEHTSCGGVGCASDATWYNLGGGPPGTGSCICRNQNGSTCGSITPGLEPTDVWSGTKYEDDVMSSGYEETGVRRSDNDRLRRRPTSAKARFRAGLGNSL